ncbi:hypothetical protein [Inovirus D_HF5_61]|nr:hypothetical protein [Inovirus D_HF5_61]
MYIHQIKYTTFTYRIQAYLHTLRQKKYNRTSITNQILR